MGKEERRETRERLQQERKQARKLQKRERRQAHAEPGAVETTEAGGEKRRAKKKNAVHPAQRPVVLACVPWIDDGRHRPVGPRASHASSVSARLDESLLQSPGNLHSSFKTK